MNVFYKNMALVMLFMVVSVLIFNMFNPVAPATIQISFSDFMDKADKGEVAQYLSWIRSDEGQKQVKEVGYFPLPKNLRE